MEIEGSSQESIADRQQRWMEVWKENPLTLREIKFTLVTADDSDYIYRIRNESGLNKYLSPPPISVEAQNEWIKGYLNRCRAGTELYFIIRRVDGRACGTVRIYDYRESSFSWGSWILDKNKPIYAAVESTILVYYIGFEVLGFKSCHFDVNVRNESVIRFHARYGARVVDRQCDNVSMAISMEEYQRGKESMTSLIYGRHTRV